MKRITARQWIIGGLLLLTVVAVIDGARLIRGGLFFNFHVTNPPKIVYEDAVYVDPQEIQGELQPVTELPDRLVVEGFQGELTFTRSDSAAINASYAAKVYAVSEEEIASLVEQVSVEWIREGERLVLHVDAPVSPAITINNAIVPIIMTENMRTPAMGGVSMKITVAVPDGVALDVDNRGMTKIDGINADVAIKHSGALSVSNVTGEVRLTSDSGAAEVEKIHGPVILNVKAGVFEGHRIVGDISGELHTGVGEIEDVQGNVTLDVNGFRLHIDGLQGDLTVSGGSQLRSFVEVEKVTGNITTSGSVSLASM